MRLPILYLLGPSFLAFLLGGCDGSLHPIQRISNPDETDVPSGTETTSETPTDTNTDTVSDADSGIADTHFTVGAQAEDYDTSDSKDSNRAWYVITTDSTPSLVDPDESHAESANGGAYLEALPDLLTILDDPNSDGNGLVNDPSRGAEVGYWVTLETTGRYYVWVRAHPTSSRDNALHVGIDGDWPESGRDIQYPDYHDQGWVWSSNQRDTGGTKFGNPLTIYLDVETTGRHLITFAMREDGFEFDEWIMTTDPNLEP